MPVSSSQESIRITTLEWFVGIQTYNWHSCSAQGDVGPKGESGDRGESGDMGPSGDSVRN